MNLNAMAAMPMFDSIRSLRSMNHTNLNAQYAKTACEKSTKQHLQSLKQKDFIPQADSTLILGNCLNELPKIRANTEKMVIVTDPPFNVGYHYGTYKDNMDSDSYYEMLGQIFQYSPFVVIHYPEEIYKIAFQVGQSPEKVISWVYNSNTPKQHRDIAFFGIKPDFKQYGQPYKNPKDKRIMQRIAEGKTARLYDWWEINQVKNVSKEKTNHPCQMPLEVMRRIVGILPEDYTIVDPFMGSGTTGLACKQLNRNFIGIEMDEEYLEISKKRINE